MSDILSSNQELLSEILRQFRNANGYTQQKIADHLGIDRSTYSKYEKSRMPDLDVIIQLAAFYNVSLEEFLGEYPNKISKGYHINPTAMASSPEDGEDNDLSRNEKRLLALYRKSIRKSEIIDFALRIVSEDEEILTE